MSRLIDLADQQEKANFLLLLTKLQVRNQPVTSLSQEIYVSICESLS